MPHRKRTVPLLLVSAIAYLVSGCGESKPDSARTVEQALTVEEQRTVRFELASDWHVWSGQGSLSSSTLRSEGAHSLSVRSTNPSNGYVGVRNLTPITKDGSPAPEVVGFDVWIPSAQLNQWWHGDTQLYIDAPSAGVWGQYLGYRSFNDLPKDQFVRVEFPVPNWIRSVVCHRLFHAGCSVLSP